MPVPDTAKLTVWLPLTALLAVAVTVITVCPASVSVLLLTERFTVGVTGATGAKATPRKAVLVAAVTNVVGVPLNAAL